MCNRILQMTSISQLVRAYTDTVVRVKASTLHCITSRTPDVAGIYIAAKGVDFLTHKSDDRA